MWKRDYACDTADLSLFSTLVSSFLIDNLPPQIVTEVDIFIEMLGAYPVSWYSTTAEAIIEV